MLIRRNVRRLRFCVGFCLVLERYLLFLRCLEARLYHF
jgi:hypothetical protein